MQYYISYFFVYAIIGWIIEVSFHVITKGKFINRGFFYGPYCPIYGFGAIAVIWILNVVGDGKNLIFMATYVQNFPWFGEQSVLFYMKRSIH